MRRWLIILMVAVFAFCLTGAALAAGPKVPKVLCYSLNAGDEMALLTIKKAASAKTAGGTITYYSISGTHFNHQGGGGSLVSFPVVGSGYVLGTTFHFTYTAMNSFSVSPYSGFHAEGKVYDLADLTNGYVFWGYYDYSAATHSADGSSYTLVDPLTITLPNSINGGMKP
jgi:hypothetical protein